MKNSCDQVVIANFTDPMMGLSYECEPIFRKLETHFPGTVELRFVMGLLVSNVYALVDPYDLADGQDVAIKNYNRRLADIYRSEESIGGMPINMDGFALFDAEHTSSLPLNLAYKAAELADANKAKLFLYNLRYATIAECRSTTREEEIMAVVRRTGIDGEKFQRHYRGGSAEEALRQDLALCRELNIHSLPAYLFQYNGNTLLVRGLIGYDDFVSIIGKFTGGEVQPQTAHPSPENLRRLIDAHPLISPIEIREAFDLPGIAEVERLLEPLLFAGEIAKKDVGRGWFVEKQDAI